MTDLTRDTWAALRDEQVRYSKARAAYLDRLAALPVEGDPPPRTDYPAEAKAYRLFADQLDTLTYPGGHP